MTAEIAVMNRVAIALAADSASTASLGENVTKIYNTADKLFQLDEREPIGAMIYDGATFMGVPLEVLIKLFRTERSAARRSVSDYANEFLAFLTASPWITETIIDEHFKVLSQKVTRDLFDAADQKAQDEKIERPEALEILLNDCIKSWSARGFSGTITDAAAEALLDRYRDFLEKYADEALGNYDSAVKSEKERLKELIILFVTRDVTHARSGIVFAGYGTSEIFPALVAWEIECVVYPNHLRAVKAREEAISLENTACIVPFAQAEMVHSFMTGIDPSLSNDVLECFAYCLDQLSKRTENNIKPHVAPAVAEQLKDEMQKTVQALKDEFLQKLSLASRTRYVAPVVDAVELLPKDQLAIMAETLVALTSFKRKMSRDTETVGGAIDVAVISKGDGFVWTKRKHYFDPALNPRYFSRINTERTK